MAFQSKDLSVLAYANGFTLWHYASLDTVALIGTPGYFDKAADILNTADLLIVNSDTGATPSTSLARVASIENGIVTTAGV